MLTIPRTEPEVRSLLAGRPEVAVLVVTPEVVARTVGFDLHRGVVASAMRRPLPRVDEVLESSRRIAVLEGLNDPENLGLIARSARAFGIDALVLDPETVNNTLGVLLKYQDDIAKVQGSEAARLVEQVKTALRHP